MKKSIKIFISIFILSIFIVGCSDIKEEEQSQKPKVSKEVNILMPDGLPTIGMAKIVKENPLIQQGYNVIYNIEKTSETLSTAIMKEEADIAVVPSNMAAIAYNKTSNYQIAGTIGEGSFYLVSTEDINEFEDLVGKEVYNTGKGLTPDITVKSLLQEKGIDPNGVNFSYVNSTSELVPLLATGKAKTAFVPEPALTSLMNKNPDIKIIKSLNEEWKNANDLEAGYPQSTLIVKSSFAKENEEFVDMFLGQVSNSVSWANDNKDEIGLYAEEIGATVESEVIGESLQRANLKFTSINDMKDNYDGYYQSLFDFDAKSVGGKLPDEGIYFEEK